ncbi:MAG: hypothetical protein ABL908_15960, partial [Hyphomicrobium sp.]
AVFVLGLLLRRWSNRHSLTDQLTDAAWEAVKARDAGVIGREVQGKLDDINRAGSQFGKAKAVAGYGIRHAIAQVVGIAGLLALLGGVVLGGLGMYWR